jgi:hypothetical protein
LAPFGQAVSEEKICLTLANQWQFLFLIDYSLKQSSPLKLLGKMESYLGRNHLCKILYKASSFGSIRPTNMAAKIFGQVVSEEKIKA